MPKTIISTNTSTNSTRVIKGTANKEYDLDAMIDDSRTNSKSELVVQVHRYKKGENPNPANLRDGQIWLSKLVEDED